MAITTENKAALAKRVGANIKKARQRKDMNQNQVGLAIGCSGQRVADREKASALPSLHFLVALCRVLDVTLNWLVFGKKDAK